MLITLALSVMSITSAATPATGYDLPAQFIAGRVYVDPIATYGKALHFYTDTGGGLFLTESAAKRLDLKPVIVAKHGGEADGPQQVLLPAFKPGSAIPLPDGGKIAVMPQKVVSQQQFVGDGMLGEAWFGGHVWTWNYPARTFRMEGDGWKPDPSASRIALGFPLENGTRSDNFARMTISVDGKPIDMLLDTGATTTLTPAALKVCADGPAERATSFIVASQFQAWRTAHPGWRVIEKGEDRSNAAMIEVPGVEIAGALVGPVWFTSRPDSNFHDYMSGMMDKRVEGAAGGNVFDHFVMSIDYPGAAAYFKCVRACQAKPRSAP
jgi:hypothetical protein